MRRESKLPVPTAKDINEAHRLAHTTARTAIEYGFRCGQMLQQKKDALDRGEFDSWVEKHCDFGRAMAYNYIKVAKSPHALDGSALRHLFPSGKPAAKQAKSSNALDDSGAPTAENDTFSGPDTTARSVKGAVMNPPESAAQGSEAGNRNTPSGEESGVREAARSPVRDEPAKPVEVAPEPAHDFSGYEPEEDDAFKANIENVLMADDKLAAMVAELKQLHREMQGLRSSRDHYQSQAGEAVRLVKARDREIERLKRDLEKARNENEALRERVAVMEAA